MAKIETTFIRPKEEFNVDTGKAKVVYDGYQNNPHEIELKENLDGDVEGVINDTFKENDNNNVAFTDNEGNEHELITSEGFGDALNEALPAALANAQVIKTTWAELKDLRDNKQLIAGSLYRITDYNCTTTQENTRSAGNQFDIVLLALSADKLAEEGWAMMNESNIYDVTFSDGVTKKCWIYNAAISGDPSYNFVDCDTLLGADGYVEDDVTFNEENKTAVIDIPSTDLEYPDLTYNYFQNSNLSAWKVWYCLDNDTARFAWADDGVDESTPATIEIIPSGGGLGDIKTYTRDESLDVVKSDTQYYGWTAQGITPNNIYTTTETPAQEDNLFTLNGKGTMSSYSGDITSYTPAHEGTGLQNGRGVIYRLIDEYNNDVCYDFKNIQFVRKLTEGALDTSTGTDTWVYTFNDWDEENDVVFDASLNFDRANNNFVGSFSPDSFALSDVVFLCANAISGNSVSGSDFCTIINAAYTRLIACNAMIINALNGEYLYCDDSLVTTDADDPAIYINNKKVLTET